MQKYCTYPKCRCQFDAPADPNWCVLHLPKPGHGVMQYSAELDIAAPGTKPRILTPAEIQDEMRKAYRKIKS